MSADASTSATSASDDTVSETTAADAEQGAGEGTESPRRGRRLGLFRRSKGDAASDGTVEKAKDEGKRSRRRRGARHAAEKDEAAEKGKSSAKDKSSDKAESAAAASDRGKWLRRLVAALAVITLLLGVVAVIELVRGAPSTTEADAEIQHAAAVDATKKALPTLFSYDYRHIDQNIAAGRAVTTGSFTNALDKLTAPAVKPLAQKYQVVVQAVPRHWAFLDSPAPDKARVMMYMDEIVSNTQLSAPRIDKYRVIATMQLINGQWKVSDITAV